MFDGKETYKYYDIHTHILPGIDDGSRDIEETREMFRQELEQGVYHIIATPHFKAGDSQMSGERLLSALEESRAAAKSVHPKMTVIPGNEILNAKGTVEALKNGEAMTVAGTRYILVEFLPSDRYTAIYHALHDYIMEGYIPIVAHVERYDSVIESRKNMEELIELGAYFQMNARSIMGGFLNRSAANNRRLVESGLIHFIGSDCHGKDRRKPVMEEAFSYLSVPFRHSEGFYKLVHENPKRMLEDKALA